MLKHLNETKIKPSRVVVLGSNGFVGKQTIQQLKNEGIETLGFSKKDINLLENNAKEKLLASLKSNDTLIIISALAPCKDISMMMNNLIMIQNVCEVIDKIALSHIVYISSDAVYSDDVGLVTETSNASPSSFHGMMHLCRELMLKQTAKKIPLTILRPSVLYGKEDPHNSYGPNRFRRLAEKNENIVLFGAGEEQRDHIFIEDVAKIISLVVQYRSEGILNIATGKSYSFREIAEEIVSQKNASSQIQITPRNNPITHRHFDIAALHKAFPLFHYTPFKEGIKTVIEQCENLQSEAMV